MTKSSSPFASLIRDSRDLTIGPTFTGKRSRTDRTEINVANTEATVGVATMRLVAESGTDMAMPVEQIIPSDGVFRSTARHIFSSADMSQRGYLLLSSTVPVAAVSITSDFLIGPLWGVLNGISTGVVNTELFFPHV